MYTQNHGYDVVSSTSKGKDIKKMFMAVATYDNIEILSLGFFLFWIRQDILIVNC